MSAISITTPIVPVNRAEGATSFDYKIVTFTMLAASILLAITGIAISSAFVVIAAGLLASVSAIVLGFRTTLDALSD